MARNPDWYRVKSFADFRSELTEEGSAPESEEEEIFSSTPEKFDDDSLENVRRAYEVKKAEIGEYQRKVMLEYFARELKKIVIIHNQTETWCDRELRLSQK